MSSFISVIIPTYKPGNYLYDCLNSLFCQSLSNREFEIIVVLNGCQDPWEKDLNSFILNNAPKGLVRLIQTDTPGVSNARNIGIDAAQGDYIAFIDDDDYISAEYLCELSAIVSSDTIALAYPVAFKDGSNNQVDYQITREYNKLHTKAIISFYKAKKFFSGPCMKLIPMSCIGNRRFDTRFKNGEDSLFMFLISDRIRYVAFSSKKAVYYRRLRPGSASVSQKRFDAFINRSHLIHEYTKLFFARNSNYHFSFYLTRLLASIHAIVLGQ